MRKLLALATALVFPLIATADVVDLNLAGLGAPDAAVWRTIDPSLSDADSAQLATDSRMRFALLSTEMALALTSSLLNTAASTGHSGWVIDVEAAYAPINPGAVGQATATQRSRSYWPTRGPAPYGLWMPALHIRKGLPFSVELGARSIYISQTETLAGQLEVKWTVHEGMPSIPSPDFAVRFAGTRLIGTRDWDLSMFDLDLIASRDFPLGGVIKLTPYGAFKMTWMSSESGVMDFGPTRAAGTPNPGSPTEVTKSQTLFPELAYGPHNFQRYLIGLRMTTYLVSMGFEGTFFPGKTFAASRDYPRYAAKQAFSAGFRLGLEF